MDDDAFSAVENERRSRDRLAILSGPHGQRVVEQTRRGFSRIMPPLGNTKGGQDLMAQGSKLSQVIQSRLKQTAKMNTPLDPSPAMDDIREGMSPVLASVKKVFEAARSLPPLDARQIATTVGNDLVEKLSYAKSVASGETLLPRDVYAFFGLGDQYDQTVSAIDAYRKGEHPDIQDNLAEILRRDGAARRSGGDVTDMRAELNRVFEATTAEQRRLLGLEPVDRPPPPPREESSSEPEPGDKPDGVSLTADRSFPQAQYDALNAIDPTLARRFKQRWDAESPTSTYRAYGFSEMLDDVLSDLSEQERRQLLDRVYEIENAGDGGGLEITIEDGEDG